MAPYEMNGSPVLPVLNSLSIQGEWYGVGVGPLSKELATPLAPKQQAVKRPLIATADQWKILHGWLLYMSRFCE
jgi:hypothetical protein